MNKKMRVVFHKLDKIELIEWGDSKHYLSLPIERESIIEGPPETVLNGIFDKLRGMGFKFEWKSPKQGEYYCTGEEFIKAPVDFSLAHQAALVAIPPKEAEPEEQEFQDDFERDSFEQFLEDCPLGEWQPEIRRKFALWIHQHIQARVKS